MRRKIITESNQMPKMGKKEPSLINLIAVTEQKITPPLIKWSESKRKILEYLPLKDRQTELYTIADCGPEAIFEGIIETL